MNSKFIVYKMDTKSKIKYFVATGGGFSTHLGAAQMFTEKKADKLIETIMQTLTSFMRSRVVVEKQPVEAFEEV